MDPRKEHIDMGNVSSKTTNAQMNKFYHTKQSTRDQFETVECLGGRIGRKEANYIEPHGGKHEDPKESRRFKMNVSQRR